MPLSLILKNLRKEKNLTQAQLAKLSGLTTSCISMIETGQREANANTISALSLAFGVSSDFLLELEDELKNITFPTGQLTDQLPNDEQRLLYAYRKLEKIDKDKLIDDAEYFARRSSQYSNLKNRN